MPQYNAADQEVVDQAEKDAKRIREQEVNDIRFILNSAAGRRFLKRFFKKWGLWRNAMTGNSHTYFNLGTQNVAQWLFGEICTAGSKDQIGEVMFVKEENDE
jgi:hypothetical protein